MLLVVRQDWNTISNQLWLLPLNTAAGAVGDGDGRCCTPSCYHNILGISVTSLWHRWLKKASCRKVIRAKGLNYRKSSSRWLDILTSTLAPEGIGRWKFVEPLKGSSGPGQLSSGVHGHMKEFLNVLKDIYERQLPRVRGQARTWSRKKEEMQDCQWKEKKNYFVVNWGHITSRMLRRSDPLVRKHYL